MNQLTPKGLFLMDALGALVSAMMLGILLPYFKEYIGMPRPILLLLAFVALLFFFYSIICYLKFPMKWIYFLRGIAMANFLYCLCTASLLIFFWLELTLLGKLFFLGELGLIMGLVILEFRMCFTTF